MSVSCRWWALVLAVVGVLVAAVVPAVAAPTAAAVAVSQCGGCFVPLAGGDVFSPYLAGTPSGPIAADASINVTVAGVAGVPRDGVRAVVLEVTAQASTARGWVIAHAHGTRRPGTTNFEYGRRQTVQSTVVVAVGSDGQVTFENRSTGSVYLSASARGYYTDGPQDASGGFVAVTPHRIINTNTGVGTPVAPIPANASITVQVGGRVGVGGATSASAALLVLTAESASTAGTIVAYPEGAARPGVTNLNYRPGVILSSTAVVPLGPSGRVTFFNRSSSSVQLLADASGWFRGGTADRNGGTVVANARLLDTGTSIGGHPYRLGPSETFDLPVTGVGGLPADGVSAVWVELSAGSANRTGGVQLSQGGPSLQYVAGQTVGTLMLVPIGADGRISITNRSSGKVRVIVDLEGYVLDPTWRPEVLPYDLPGPSSAATFTDVSCPSVGNCVAVGANLGGSIVGTLHDGAWAVANVPAAPGYGSTYLTRIDCITLTNCQAAAGPLLDTLSPSGWRASSPYPDTEWHDVSCASASFCVATGTQITHDYTGTEYRLPVAAKYDGTRWYDAATLPFGGDGTTVSCAAPQSCVILGSGLWRLDASGQWQRSDLQLPSPASLDCPDPSKCTALGSAHPWAVDAITPSGETITHPLPSGPSAAISCPNVNACIGVGGREAAAQSSSRWTLQSLPSAASGATEQAVTGVSCPQPGQCVAVGSYTNSDGATVPLVQSLANSVWTSSTPATPPARSNASLRDVSCVPASTECFAVGNYLDSASISHPVVQHRTDSSWSRSVLPVPPGAINAALLHVSCASTTHCVAIGTYRINNGSTGFDEIWNGTTWTQASDPPGLVAIDCPNTDTDTCMAVTTTGAWLLHDGVWTETGPPGGFASARDVDCLSTTSCVVLDDSSLATWNGATWTTLYLRVSYGDFRTTAVSCTTVNECVVVGTDYDNESSYSSTSLAVADILDAGSQTPVYNVALPAFNTVACPEDANCVVSDGAGNFFRLVGRRLAVMATHRPAVALPFDYGLSCTAIDQCVAAGTAVGLDAAQQMFVDTLG